MTDKNVHTTELDNVKKATAMMFAALVDTLVGTDSAKAKLFVDNLDKIYHHIRNDTDDLNALETISLTKEMISGWSFAEGKGTPLMHKL